ncbi:MGMT family protein [candidate division WOR-3 bacterium]|nr:MGMT family protein [candidate division WOR-3 bacterium]
MSRSFYERVIVALKMIPPGQVATYGQIARYAGNPGAARHVAYILHSSSRKEDLPWQRVVNSKGGISLKRGHGYELQRQLLIDEGIAFDSEDRIDLERFAWPG